MHAFGSIATIAYDATSQCMTVGFNGGRTLKFDQVPRMVQVMLLSDPEPDVAFDRHVFGQFASAEVGVGD